MSEPYPDTYRITERGDGCFVIERLYTGFNPAHDQSWWEVFKHFSTTRLYRFKSVEEAMQVLNRELDFNDKMRNSKKEDEAHEKAKDTIIARHPFTRESKLPNER